MDNWEKFNKTPLPEKKKIFTVTYIWKILLMEITRSQKDFVKMLK